MMRVYMPEDLYYSQRGQRATLLGRCSDIEGTLVLYIVTTDDGDTRSTSQSQHLDVVGEITDTVIDNQSDRVYFRFDPQSGHLTLPDESPDTEQPKQIILYSLKTFSYIETSTRNSSSELTELSEILNLERERNSDSEGGVLILNKTIRGISGILSLLQFILLPLNWIFKGTAVAQHFQEWKLIFSSGGENRKNIRRILPIILDVLLGLAIMLLIKRYTKPAEYLMRVTHEVIVHLRKLLESLRGSPVGLKVNVQLNDFLLNCFIYHINLWKAFLNIVFPAINYLFAVLTIFGLCGFSFQLAVLADLLVIITIHAHCFYIYAAVLYRLELVGLKALWRIVRGRRKNVLKNRVESYDYKNSQLFMATLLFSSLLFLLPNVLVYYVVFSTVRLGIYCFTYTLLVIRRKLLQLPLYDIIRYLVGIHISPDHFVMEIVEEDRTRNIHDNSRNHTTVVRIRPQKASIHWTPVEFMDDHPTVLNFIGDLVKGEIKGFIRPRLKDYQTK